MLIFSVSPCISALHLPTLLCAWKVLVGSMYRNTLPKDQRGDWEWSPVSVPMPSPQGSVFQAEGQRSCPSSPYTAELSKPKIIPSSCPLRPSGKSSFPHLINIPLLKSVTKFKVLVCLLSGPTFHNSCEIFAGCVHPATGREPERSNTYITLFTLNPCNSKGSWFWLSLSSFWKITFLWLISCLSKCPNRTWKDAALPNFHFLGKNLLLNCLGINETIHQCHKTSTWRHPKQIFPHAFNHQH